MSRRSSGSPPVRMVTLGRERRDLVDDPEALLGAELAAVGEVLGADAGLPPASR